MRNNYYVVTVPAADASDLPSILLTFDDKRYLFNCGENTQRQLLAQKMPMRKIKAVFMTSGWQSHAGLPGLMLSVHDSNGLPPLSLHGPQGLAHYLASLRSGQQRAWQFESRSPFTIEEYSQSGQIYEDSNVRIVPIRALGALHNEANVPGLADRSRVLRIALSVWTGRFLQEIAGEWRPSTGKRKRPDDDEEEAGHGGATITTEQVKAFQRYLGGDLPRARYPRAAMSYWIQARDLPGKFDVTRAQALGIQPGPQYGLLQRGRAITLPDGKVVQPEDVLGLARSSAPLLLIHCPGIDYVESLVDQTALWPTLTDAQRASTCMIHCAPLEVLRHPRYVQWARSLGDIQHYVSNKEATPDTLTNLKAAAYAEDMRSVLGDFSRVPELREGRSQTLPDWIAPDHILEKALEIAPYPKLKVTRAAVGRVKSVPEYRQLLQEHSFAQSIDHVAKLESSLVITTLGTGSAGPSSYRNVSGTHVQISPAASMLLDCGEGTLGQLHRAFGDRFELVMRSLKVIYISHMHADHHLGLIGVAQAWLELNKHTDLRLVILCPGKLARSFEEYGSIDPTLSRGVILVNTLGLQKDFQGEWGQDEVRRLSAAVPEISRAVCVPTPHSERAMCVRFDFVGGESVAYSGDSRPLPEFAVLGHGVTCLVHEATLEHDKQEEAIAKRHSTITEALDISKRMEAKSTILTHISQRYPKYPIITEQQANEMHERNVIVAHDSMQVPISDIATLAAAQPRLRKLWAAVDLLQQEGKLEADEEPVETAE